MTPDELNVGFGLIGIVIGVVFMKLWTLLGGIPHAEPKDDHRRSLGY